MSTDRKAERPVNRLLDIQVEEVSLVDRAANEHRFLIVKRSDTPMADTQDDTTTEGAAPDAGAPPTDEDQQSATPPDSPLSTAIAALEGLTSTVELLGTMGAHEADARLAPLAVELKATAEALLARAGVDGGAEPHGDQGEDTTSGEESPGATEGAAFADHLAAARAALTQLAALASAPKVPPQAARPDDAAAPKLSDELTRSLAAMTESFRALAETVKEQQQRLARVEKHFGLPNSAQSPERVRKAEPEEVGWPMDLNHPMDRESVDKAVSFHDL